MKEKGQWKRRLLELFVLIALHEILGYGLVVYRVMEGFLTGGTGSSVLAVGALVAFFLLRLVLFFLLPGVVLGCLVHALLEIPVLLRKKQGI